MGCYSPRPPRPRRALGAARRAPRPAPRGHRAPTAAAPGSGGGDSRRRGRRGCQLGCHPAERRLALGPRPGLRGCPSAARPLPPRRAPPAAPHPCPAGPPSPGFPSRPMASPPPHNRPGPAAPHPPPLPPGSRGAPGPRRLPALTCHVPDPGAEGGASRPREGRGRHFPADKGRRHVGVGRNRPRGLPGGHFRRMRSARARRGPRVRAAAQKFCPNFCAGAGLGVTAFPRVPAPPAGPPGVRRLRGAAHRSLHARTSLKQR